jgi:hypothetical protein
MDTNRLDKVQEMAQTWIKHQFMATGLKTQLQAYTNKGSFFFSVGRLIEDEGIVDERAVEMVLEEYATNLYLESIE